MYGERLRGDTVGVWMRASTATRCPLALNNIAAATNLEIVGAAQPTIGAARPASAPTTATNNTDSSNLKTT